MCVRGPMKKHSVGFPRHFPHLVSRAQLFPRFASCLLWEAAGSPPGPSPAAVHALAALGAALLTFACPFFPWLWLENFLDHSQVCPLFACGQPSHHGSLLVQLQGCVVSGARSACAASSASGTCMVESTWLGCFFFWPRSLTHMVRSCHPQPKDEGSFQVNEPCRRSSGVPC